MKEPAIGDLVIFEGLRHHIVGLEGSTFVIASEMPFESGGRTKPRFKSGGSRSDLRWSDELAAWYLWGRLLSKGRGNVGVNEGRIVADLRDREVISSRPKRRDSSPPAGGEELNLYLSLFSKGIQWHREIERIRRGEGLSSVAQSAVEDYEVRYKKKLTDGYAFPGADDSWGED